MNFEILCKGGFLKIFKPKSFWLYSLVLVVWAAVTWVTTSLVFKLELREVETAFGQRVEQLHQGIGHIARDNEAILDGFSAFLGSIEYVDRDGASRYARQILDLYPHVYGLGVVRSVKRQDLAQFVAGQKRTGFPKFKVKAFNYESDRTWQTVKNKPMYNPIIFIESMSLNTKQLIGLDIDSMPFLRDALSQSAQLQSSVSSIPFKLLEEVQGYVLFRPVLNRPSGKQAFAVLVINTEAIQKEIDSLVDNLELRLYHASYSSDEQKGLLFHVEAPAPDRLEARLLPKLTAERKLDSRGQPFVLRVDKQLGWSDLNLSLVITTGCTSILSLGVLLLFLNTHFRVEEQRRRSADRLLHMATHDALTGLPNRTLLEDRFSQVYSRTLRRDMQFSTMFLDLNGFKLVNDTYGHEVGDQLLKVVGGLLTECLREEDTLCRISGDEFVILLEDTPYENAEKVAQKIQAKMALPVLIQDIELNVGISLGIAVYPDDGTTMSELLGMADERMYEAKKQSKVAMAKSGSC
jgi:diguanylate cyclase (GGDEF)-like protein